MAQYIVLPSLIQCFNTVVEGSVLFLMPSLQKDVCPEIQMLVSSSLYGSLLEEWVEVSAVVEYLCLWLYSSQASEA